MSEASGGPARTTLPMGSQPPADLPELLHILAKRVQHQERASTNGQEVVQATTCYCPVKNNKARGQDRGRCGRGPLNRLLE